MATPDYWAERPGSLTRAVVCADVGRDHCRRRLRPPVRRCAQWGLDWSAWEAKYGARERGHRLIHPGRGRRPSCMGCIVAAASWKKPATTGSILSGCGKGDGPTTRPWPSSACASAPSENDRLCDPGAVA